jgi:hypothetical protein
MSKEKIIEQIKEGWNVWYNPKPIPDRSHDFDFWHDNYDGADGGNGLSGTASSALDAVNQINEMECEQ